MARIKRRELKPGRANLNVLKGMLAEG